MAIEDEAERENALYDRHAEISEAVSHLSPKTKAAASFQILMAGAEADIGFDGGTVRQRKASQTKVNRLLSRALDFMLADDGLPNARACILRKELNPKVVSGVEPVAENRPSVDDAASDARHLYDLLNVAVGRLVETPREADLAEVNSLFWIARDVAEQLRDDVTSAA